MLTKRVAELEARLQRLGQGVADDNDMVPRKAPPSAASAADSPAAPRPHDMTALLGRLALGPTAATTKRYAGTEGAAFYLSEDDESDDESRSDRLDELGLAVPWARSGAPRLGRMGGLPGALLDRCRELMVSRRVARELWAAFWELTSWR